MGDKKRKSLDAGSEQHTKKKSKKTTAVDVNETPAVDETIKQAKKSRKRAVDFLSDEEGDIVNTATPKDAGSTDASSKDNKKKSKKSKSASNVDETVVSAAQNETPDAPVKSKEKKKTKKSKDDTTEVLQEDVTTDVAAVSKEKKKRKSKKSEEDARATEVLTADGTNGVAEQKDTANVKVKTSKAKANKSMQAEAIGTVDKEIEEEFAPATNGHAVDVVDAEDSDDENGAPLLAGFDSDSPDDGEDALPESGSKKAKPPHLQRSLKKIRKAQEAKEDEEKPGTVYVGRIPHGFYEPQMREYFSQFGDITRLRLSRNKHTGMSKHFAFVEFASAEVAKIVASTMDNYLMFGHILKCKFAADETLHPDVWKGANKKFRKIPHDKLDKQKLESPKSVEHWRNKNDKETKKREKRAKLLKEKLGYDMPTRKLLDPSSVVEQKKINGEKTDEIEDAIVDEIMRLDNSTADSDSDESAIIGTSGIDDNDDASNSDVSDADDAGVPPIDATKKKNMRKPPGPLSPYQLKKWKAERKREKLLSMKLHKKKRRSEKKQENHKKHMLQLADHLKRKRAAAIAAGADAATINEIMNPKKPPKLKEKYIPPTHRKQLALAAFARDYPEEHAAKKEEKTTALQRARAEKKAKRAQKMTEKFGPKFKGGEKSKARKSGGARNE